MAKKRFEMTEDHKHALAEGRTQGRAVRAYLEALETDRRRTRRSDPATLRARVTALQEDIEGADDPTKRLELIQKRLDLERQLADAEEGPDLEALEEEFVGAVTGYAERKGITYTAWREAGVPAAVLKRAGVPRTRRAS